jgi:hypothetical protein
VAPGIPHLHVIADLGLGHLAVGDRFFDRDGPRRWRHDEFDALQTGSSRAACLGTP